MSLHRIKQKKEKKSRTKSYNMNVIQYNNPSPMWRKHLAIQRRQENQRVNTF